MDRRNFLGQLTAAVLLSSCTSPLTRPSQGKKGTILIARRESSTSSVLQMLDLDTMDSKEFSLSIPIPHSVVVNPLNRNEIFIFDTFGDALVLDLMSEKEKKFSSVEGNCFSGHAIAVPEKNTFWSSEYDGTSTFIRERSLQDQKLTGKENSVFEGSHHLVKLPGQPIIGTAFTSPGSFEHHFLFFDFEKRRLIRKIKTDCDPGHFLAISKSEVVGVSNLMNIKDWSAAEVSETLKTGNLSGYIRDRMSSVPSPVFYANTSGEFKTFMEPSYKDKFTFGMGMAALNMNERHFISTFRNSDSLIVWKDFKILNVINIPRPNAVIPLPDGKSFLAFNDSEIRMYKTSNFEYESVLRFDKDILIVYRYA